ncbi:MAG TPA: WHG domain-containing protein [Ktedonobacteraceae bacterium]|nr:WHG domain-containing protein [Ktedonobacteraceae bacterium]
MTHRVGLDRQMVIQAAAELADANGVEQVTLATLAARLGVRTPTLYHYVDGLDGLRRELDLLGTRELARTLGRAVMGRSGDEAIEALALAYRTFAQTRPGLYAAGVRAADPEDRELLEAEAEVVEIALRVLVVSQPDRDDAIHTVRIWRSMLHGFLSLEQDGGFGLPQDVDETFRRLVLLMIQAARKDTLR